MTLNVTAPRAVALISCILGILLIAPTASAQLDLPGPAPYVQNFDDIGNGLPTGWTVRTGASASALGTAVALTTSPLPWNNTSGAFKNLASSDGLDSDATTTAQAEHGDRALGIRQTGSFGDPGAAFALQISNTLGRTAFGLSLNHHLLSPQSRSTTWSVQYAIGSSPTTWMTLGTYTTGSPGVFGSTPFSHNFGTDLDDLSENVWFRIVALTGSSGTGSRDTYAIDDFELTWEGEGPPVPEISHASLGDTESTDDRTAVATITDDNLVTEGTNRPAIWYRVDGSSFTSDYFTTQTGDEFEFTIPGQPAGSTVDYYIGAANNQAVATHPFGGDGMNPPGSTPPGSFHTYTVLFPPGLRVWTGNGDGSSWSDSANWGPAQVPGAGDDVLLDNSTDSGSYTVVLPGGAVTTTIRSLVITPADAFAPITLNLPSANTANPGFSVTGPGEAVVLNAGGALRNSSGASAGTGVAVSNTMRINNGGRYTHNTTRANAALLNTISSEDFGIVEFDVPGSGSFSPSMSNRMFGSLELRDTAGDGRTYSSTAAGPATVRGDLVIGTSFTANIPITVRGTLDLEAGTLTVVQPADRPFTLASDASRTATITNGAGTVSGDLRFQRHFATPESGWRGISPPVAGTHYSALSTTFRTHGGEWAMAGGSPVLYTFDADAQEWHGITGHDAPFAPGEGYLFYMHDEAAGGSPILPATWQLTGAENASPIARSLEFNTDPDDSFNLVGNPFMGNLDWHEVRGPSTSLGTTYWVWDPAIEGYRLYNETGEVGSAGRLIAPFTSVVVQATGVDAEAVFTYGQKDNHQLPQYFGRPGAEEGPAAHVRLHLEGAGMGEHETYLVFREGSVAGRDPADAPKLMPLSGSYATIWLEDENGRALAIDARGADLDEEDFRIHFATTQPGINAYTLSWPLWHAIPEGWSFTLTDHVTGQQVDLRENDSYTFTSAASAQSRGVEEGVLFAAASDVQDPFRFTISASSQPVSTDPGVTGPAEFSLASVYPNPFSGSTSVSFTLPGAVDVTLAVYDVLGRRVAMLAEGEHAAGAHSVLLDGSSLSSGIYVVRLVAGSDVQSRRVTVVR